MRSFFRVNTYCTQSKAYLFEQTKLLNLSWQNRKSQMSADDSSFLRVVFTLRVDKKADFSTQINALDTNHLIDLQAK